MLNWLTYKFFNEALFTSGRLPVRLLFPRNLKRVQYKMMKHGHQLDGVCIVGIIDQEFLTGIQVFPE